MKNKYNLVYVPLNKNAEIITIAQQFASYADQYLLCNQALPHVTLCQFEAMEQDLEKIWARAETSIHTKLLSLRFDTISILDKHNYHWVSLMPDQREELFDLHDEALKVLEISDKVHFDPHMTLFNSVNDNFTDAVNNFAKSFSGLEDEFRLALGMSGFAGQFKQIIYR